MDLPLELISDLVALRISEFPDWRAQRDLEGSHCRLSEMIRLILEREAVNAVAELPLNLCTSLYDLTSHIHSATDWGEEYRYSCLLPGDFMKLAILWMPDWPGPLSEENPGDSLQISLGDAAPDWLKKRRTRPALQLIKRPEGTELWFGPTSATTPRAAACVARPTFDSKAEMLRKMQPAALNSLIANLASGINP